MLNSLRLIFYILKEDFFFNKNFFQVTFPKFLLIICDVTKNSYIYEGHISNYFFNRDYKETCQIVRFAYLHEHSERIHRINNINRTFVQLKNLPRFRIPIDWKYSNDEKDWFFFYPEICNEKDVRDTLLHLSKVKDRKGIERWLFDQFWRWYYQQNWELETKVKMYAFEQDYAPKN